MTVYPVKIINWFSLKNSTPFGLYKFIFVHDVPSYIIGSNFASLLVITDNMMSIIFEWKIMYFRI